MIKDLEHVTGEPGDVEMDPDAGEGACVTFRNVSFRVKKRSGETLTILDNISGHFEKGSLVALMGPSGCGKTTLLDILADKKSDPYEGTIHLNGRPRDALFSRVTTYIPQDDIMPAHLTVQEVVSFYMACKMERPQGLSRKNALYWVEERLKFMGLYEVRHTKVGNESVRGISGGQRRRLSLACGLSSAARVFFADEPTSGLSGTDAESVVRYMRLLTKKFGLTLIVSIHQPRPEVTKLFDHLLLLTSNPGRTVYNGPMRNAAKYAESVGHNVPEYSNPTDFLLDLVTPDTKMGRPQEFIDHYNENFAEEVDDLVAKNIDARRHSALEMVSEQWQRMSEEFGDMPRVRNVVFGVRFRRQFSLVFRRQVLMSWRDPLGVGMELGVSLGQSVVIGIAYWNVGTKESYNQVLFIFMMVMTVSLVGLKVMPKLIDERVVVKKETSEALYSDWAYILSFSIINTIVGLVGNGLFMALVFVMSHADWEWFPCMFAWLTGLYLIMDAMYTMVAAIALDSTNAVTLALPFLTLFLLYNGFTVQQDHLPDFMKWLMELSPVAYCMEAILMMVTDLEPDTFSQITTTLGYQHQEFKAICFMVGWWVFFRILGVICFKRLNNLQR